MKKIIVNVKNSYPIIISNKVFNDSNLFSIIKKNDQVILITNIILKNLYMEEIYFHFKKRKLKFYPIILDDGENSKDLSIVNKIITKLLKKNFDRNSILIAFGGGVIGDLTGFIASIYQRGIRFVQIPTTLLSQIDASIGGKTGINHILGKNMIGTFYNPISVFINFNFLKTLSKKNLISGISEIIKYGIILDKDFFLWLEKNFNSILNLESKKINFCIEKCCNIKKRIIEKDQKENNIRAFLNFGHTYGHAIESFTKYEWTHGESISAGMVMASKTSLYMNLIDNLQVNRIINLFEKIGLPTKGPKNMKYKDYIYYMNRDKKKSLNKLTLVLIKDTIGKVKLYNNISECILKKVIFKCR